MTKFAHAVLAALGRLILVGMSGAGKSTIAKWLASSHGFRVVDFDEEIIAALKAEYGEEETQRIFTLMSMPWLPESPDAQRRYFALEEQIIGEAVSRSSGAQGEQVEVWDLGGSSAHLNARILKLLRLAGFVVFIDQIQREVLKDRFLEADPPRPIVWGANGELFKVYAEDGLDDGSGPECRVRNFRRLCEVRAGVYADICHLRIPTDRIDGTLDFATVESAILRATDARGIRSHSPATAAAAG